MFQNGFGRRIPRELFDIRLSYPGEIENSTKEYVDHLETVHRFGTRSRKVSHC